MARSRRFSALGAFFVATVLLTACGGGIPGDAVVTVGDKTIKKDTYEHWLKIAAISAQGQADPTSGDGPPKVQIPEPPKFTACIADKKKSAPKPAKGQPKQTDAQFKTQCKTEYEGLRDQTLQFLISSQWIASEAADQGVKVSEKDVIKQFKMTKEQSFPKEADFQKFLKSSGMTINDLLLRVRLDTTSNKLRDKIIKDKKNPTSANIKAYYKKNQSKFSQPERRDLRLVLTKTKAQAEKVLSMLKGGAQFSKVAKKFSIDQASKNQGGVLSGASKGQQEKALDDAVFKAKKGKLTGPVKTQFGYYVFKVQKITKASRQSLKDATPTIKQLLSSQGEQTALNDFVKDFQKKWKGMTDCRSGYVTQDCKNAPKQDTTSTGAPGSDGQGAPPQGAPPQGAPPQGAPPQGAPPQGAPPQGGGGAQQAPPQTVPVTPPSGGGSGSGSGSGGK